MSATKALILTWVMIGLLVAGAVGFYLGRNSVFQNSGGLQGGVQPPGAQQLGPQGGQPQGSPPPTGAQQPLQRGPSPGPNQ